jgi:peptidoglycan/xylan/chitin deacetylase (PgdA/CDA1 family)
MYLSKTPSILKPLASDLVWDIRTSKKEVFLTFDDGPIPEVTPLVLAILDAYNAKATFFCVGENVQRNYAVYPDIISRGHAVGNHTFQHENGWRTSHMSYLKSALKCREYVDSKLFRPPYGRIRKQQANALKKRFNLIMWDVLSGDFDVNRTPEECYNGLVRYTKPGSVVVFHDSLKAKERVLVALPKYLAFLKNEGYSCALLTAENTQKRTK